MKIGNYTVKEMMPGVYGLSNCAVASFLILGKEKALLLDTGYGIANLKEAVEQLTTLPLYVVNSHGHIDHTSGNFYFPGPYYMHQADLEVYRRHNSSEYRRIGFDAVQKLRRIVFWANWIPKDFDVEAYANSQAAENFVFVQEGYIFDLGGVTAEVVEIPGHTPGSIGLLIKEKGLFFASDGINSNVWLFLPESQKLSIYQQTLKKVNALNFTYLVTGHSVKLEPKSNLENYLAVALNPDLDHAKKSGKTEFAPDVQPIRCLDKTNQGKKRKDWNRAGIVITREKL